VGHGVGVGGTWSACGSIPEAKVTDERHPGTTTKFWVPDFDTLAILDLEAMK
jgi:hypothetical protein